jgi:hypothetical protein
MRSAAGRDQAGGVSRRRTAGEGAEPPESRPDTCVRPDLSAENRGNAESFTREEPDFVCIPLFSARIIANFLQ